MGRASGSARHKETVSSRHNHTDVHIDSWRPWQHTHSLHWSKPDGVPSAERASGHEPSSLTQRLSPVVNCLQRKNWFFSQMKSHWVHTIHSRAGFMPKSKWPTQNELNGISGSFFFLFCFVVWAFFKTWLVCCLHIWVSDFVLPWILFVCVSLCICAYHIFSLFFCLFISGLFVLLFACFLKKEKKKAWSWMGGEDLREDDGGKTMDRTQCMGEIFPINK